MVLRAVLPRATSHTRVENVYSDQIVLHAVSFSLEFVIPALLALFIASIGSPCRSIVVDTAIARHAFVQTTPRSYTENYHYTARVEACSLLKGRAEWLYYSNPPFQLHIYHGYLQTANSSVFIQGSLQRDVASNEDVNIHSSHPEQRINLSTQHGADSYAGYMLIGNF